MARRGRKRKSGARWGNGRIKQPHTRQLKDAEKAVVLAQPHRRGHGMDQLCESPLGRLVMRRKLPRVIFDVGLEWGSFVRRWQAARGIPPEIRIGPGSGRELPAIIVARWGRRIAQVEASLKRISAAGFRAVRTLTVNEREIDRSDEPEAVEVLRELARLMRRPKLMLEPRAACPPGAVATGEFAGPR